MRGIGAAGTTEWGTSKPRAESSRDRLETFGRMPATALLLAGLIGPLLYVAVFTIDGLTRPGYSAWRNYTSQLALGSRGWLQELNFVLFGVLVVCFAIGLRMAIRGSRGSVAAPILLGLFGLGFVLAAVFPMDPGLGYPPGAPSGVPATFSGHAVVHGWLATGVGSLLVVATLVMAWHFGSAGSRGWMLYSIGIALVVIVFGGVTLVVSNIEPIGFVQRIVIFGGWTWISMLALHLIRERAAP